jgi:hypothetical protein
MRRVLPLLGLIVVAAFGAAFTRGGGPVTAFRLPDASAACRLDGVRLTCANLTVRSGLSLPAQGTPAAVPARVWWDASTPVLRHWSRNGLTCRADGETILCRNASGASISLDGSHIAVAL